MCLCSTWPFVLFEMAVYVGSITINWALKISKVEFYLYWLKNCSTYVRREFSAR